MAPARPQDVYPRIGVSTAAVRALADELAVIRASCETWDLAALRVDSGSPWSTEESATAAIDDLAAAEESLRAAVGRLEGAWSVIGRLSAD